ACISDRGVRRRIGIAHKNAKGKVDFDEAYPGWKYVRSIINIDAGLFLVDEVSEWSAQVLGVGRIGELIDLNVDTLNLDLVGVPDYGSQAPPPRRDQTPERRPLALQWGGHSLLEPGGQGVMQFALASSLANVCRMLDVEIIRDWSLDHSLYWGKVGHYKIGYS